MLAPTRSVVLLPLLLSSVVMGQESAPRVLHLGNSYTHFNDLQVRVAELLRATVPALSEAEGARLTGGGLRLPDHVERVERGDPQWVDALTGEPGRWTWIVLQDQSQVPGFPESESYWQDSAEAVTVLDGYAVDQGAETVLFMTWGRRDGDSSNAAMYPDFETMNARLDAGYQAYATRGSVLDRTIWIAPVGRAFGAVYDRLLAAGTTPEDAGTDFHRLYDADGSHPSALGTALSAGVFVRTLTGYTPQWDSAPPGVDAADLGWLVEAVDAAVVPFDDLSYPWATGWSDYAPPVDMDPALGWVVSGDRMCATVGISDEVADMPTTTVGAMHGDVAGCGSIWMLANGRLSIESLETEPGATGELRLMGGSLRVGTLATPTLLSAGDLAIASAATAELEMTGGALSLGAGVSGIALAMTGGTLTVVATEGPIFSDSAALAGTIDISGELAESSAVLTAGVVTVADDVVHNLPEDWFLEVRTADGVDTLWAVSPEAGGGEDGGRGVDEGTAGESTMGGSDGGGDGDGVSGGSPSTDKSGCSAVAGAGGGLVVALMAVAVRRRHPRM